MLSAIWTARGFSGQDIAHRNDCSIASSNRTPRRCSRLANRLATIVRATGGDRIVYSANSNESISTGGPNEHLNIGPSWTMQMGLIRIEGSARNVAPVLV